MRTIAQVGEVQSHRIAKSADIMQVIASGEHNRPGIEGPGCGRCVVYGPNGDKTFINTTEITLEHWLIKPEATLPADGSRLLCFDTEQVIYIAKGSGVATLQHLENDSTVAVHDIGAGDCLYLEAFQPLCLKNSGREDLIGMTWSPTSAPRHPRLVKPGEWLLRGTGYRVVKNDYIVEIVNSRSQLRPEVDLPDFGRCVVFGQWDDRTQKTHSSSTVYFEYSPGSETPSDGNGFVVHNIEQCEYIIQGHGLILYGDGAGEKAIAVYDLYPGDHFYHDAFLQHKFINVGKEPVVGISFTPTGGYRDTWRMGTYAHPVQKGV